MECSVKIVDVRDTIIPIKSDIANAYIDFSKMTASVVAVVTDVVCDGKPIVGFGFNSNGRYAQQGLLRERFMPRLKEAKADAVVADSGDNLDPHKIWNILMANEKPGGHGERSVAVGVIDMAVWDAVAKIEGKPLFRLLAERYRDGAFDETVSIYAAGGYYHPGKGIKALRDEMKSYLDRGYTQVKMKVGGVPLAEDLKRLEAVINIVGDGKNVAVDVNGRFNIKQAIEFGEAIKPYKVKWYEEVGDPLDFELQKLAQHYPFPMATGENLFSMLDARNLIRYGGMRSGIDILQFDPALSYGLVEYLRTLDMLQEYGFSPRDCVPHGGHQFALNIAAGLGLGGNESYPDVFRPFNGFADNIQVEGGRVRMPDIPGIGFEAKNELFSHMRELANL
jgi:L-alanine-DL-glutamate epimerase-like enolase superfamily enzyme